MSLRNEESVVPIKETVYNIDAVTGENILIVEGPFDAWRMGGPTVCLFGTAFKQQQVMRILSKFPKNIYICFDQETEAQKNANRLAACFAPFVSHVEVIEIPVKDPALLSPEQALEIRNELQL
jgi:DNA primase